MSFRNEQSVVAQMQHFLAPKKVKNNFEVINPYPANVENMVSF
jgi:hypothetical protein